MGKIKNWDKESGFVPGNGMLWRHSDKHVQVHLHAYRGVGDWNCYVEGMTKSGMVYVPVCGYFPQSVAYDYAIEWMRKHPGGGITGSIRRVNVDRSGRF